jgi:hypothetical protein
MAAEDQGIMSLPMEGEAASQNMPQMPLEESYDAVSQGLENASPQAAADVQQLMASIMPQLDQLSDEELNQLLQIVQYLYEGGEAEYAKRLQEAISAGAIDAGDLPEEFDPEVLSSIGTVLLQAIRQREGNMQAAQGPMPTEQQFAKGGIAEAARIVAGRGRSGDTMLAHINPEEAKLLRSRGGMGTINPKTGLPEYGIFSSIGKAIKGVFKGIANAVKSIVKSPIGKILATVALATFLGPGAMGVTGLGMSAGTAAAVASGTVTALGGGNLKEVLTAGATAYFGAPGGPVSQYVGAAGITNVAANAAVTAGIVGTGTGLLTGQKLSDAVKTGLTAGATSGLTTGIQQGFTTQAPGTPARTDLPPVEDRFLSSSTLERPLTPAAVAAGAQAPVSPAAVPTPVAPPTNLAGTPIPPGTSGYNFNPTPIASEGMTFDTFGNVVPVGSPAATNADPTGLASLYGAPAAGGAPAARAPGAPAARVPGAVPPAGESFMKMAGGIGDFMQGKPGAFDAVKQGASDLFMPPTYTPAELQNTDVYRNAIAAKASPSEALKMAQAEYNPSIVRQYGPMAAAGLGIAGMMGGFTPGKVPPSALASQMRGTPGLDLINRNPNQYLVQGLPGVQYSQQGNITGSSAWSPTAGMSDVQVATPNYTGYNYNPYSQNYFRAADGGLASLARGGYPRKTGAISGPGTETSDSIPAMLSDGEFVMTAKAVKGIGGGSRRAGAKKMYALMHQLERNASRG